MLINISDETDGLSNGCLLNRLKLCIIAYSVNRTVQSQEASQEPVLNRDSTTLVDNVMAVVYTFYVRTKHVYFLSLWRIQ